MDAIVLDHRREQKQDLKARIFTIEVLVIVIPSMLLFYTLYEADFILSLPHLFMICFAFILILSGIFILRDVIGHFITVIMAVKAVDEDGRADMDIKSDVAELRNVRDSLNSIMVRLDKTASELNKRSFELLSLKELMEIAKRSLDIKELQALVLDRIMMVTGAQIGSFLEYNPLSHEFLVCAVRGPNAAEMIDCHIPIDESLAKYTVLEKRSILIKDIQNDPRTCRINNDKYGSPSFLSVPVVLGNDVSAVVNLAGKPAADQFDEDDERISTIMLEEIDFALKNARLHYKVRELLNETEASNVRLQEEINRRMETEVQLYNYQKNLEVLVEERTKELMTVNIQLKEEIAERRLAQAALQESEERLRTIIDSAKDWIFIKDTQSCYSLVNKSMASDLGTSESSILGKTSIEIFGIHEGLLIERRDDQVFNGSIIEFETNLEVGKTKRTIYIIKVPVHDKDGRIIALCGIARDITERKKMEAQLIQAEKMEALGNLAGGVAHDLNNVLGVLVGYSELFLEKIPRDNPLHRQAGNILKSSERGAAIIQDLLTLARRGVPTSVVVDLNQVINDYFETLEFERLKTYHPWVSIKAELSKEAPYVKGSPVHLGKTLMNLVSNAAEALPEKGDVIVRTSFRYLDRPVRGYDKVEAGNYAVLQVSDNGNGISEADIGKIFEPFYTKKVMGRSGTGLGLAVVWGTVKDHRGYIDVQSREGQGTVFTLYFPCTDEIPEKARKAVSYETIMGHGQTVFVIDNQKDQRDLAVDMLERLGYKAQVATGGEEALIYLAGANVDLVLLDLTNEQGMDGITIYRKILDLHPGQRTVIISDYSEAEQVVQARADGIRTFVRKPYNLEDIGLAVKEALIR
ncbi:MAG: Sensor histidine kinase RcsC [Syntrophus sp. SKADARSKE-3]|nr:Sensor histidine kinase RcsC [Syntrophus sp. SKADARSKE-3]